MLLHVALPISQHTRQSHIARFALVGYAVPITSSAVERAAGEGVGGILIFFVFFFFPALVVVFSFIFKHTSFSFWCCPISECACGACNKRCVLIMLSIYFFFDLIVTYSVECIISQQSYWLCILLISWRMPHFLFAQYQNAKLGRCFFFYYASCVDLPVHMML